MIKVLQKLYTNVTYHMDVAGKKRAFKSNCGLKQPRQSWPYPVHGTLKPLIFAGME
jgi:hypothetical protein